MAEYITNSADETMLLGKKIGGKLPENSVVCFFGDLGAGKTTFIKGLASAAVECDYEDVNSPTFVYLNIYEGRRKVFHFDLYRLKGPEDFLGMGFEDYLHSGGICCIEWSERIHAFLPADCFKVNMAHVDESKRKISITPWDENG